MYSNSYSSGGSDMETFTEREGAFTLQMPSGWQNQANLRREQSVNQIIASSTSPDQSAVIHMGDPRIPLFLEPGLMAQMMAFQSPYPVHPYVPAEPFFQDYLRQNFGGAPGFRVAEVVEDPMFQQMLAAEAMRWGHAARGTAVCIVFGHQGTGRPMSCLLHGATLTDGTRWSAEVLLVSVSAPEYIEQVNEMALRMVASRQINRLWLMNQENLQMQQQIMNQMGMQTGFPMPNMPPPTQNPWMSPQQNLGPMNPMMPDPQQMGYGQVPPQPWGQPGGMPPPNMMPPQNAPSQGWMPQGNMPPQQGAPPNGPQSPGWPQSQEMQPPWMQPNSVPPPQTMPQNASPPQGWMPQSDPPPLPWQQPNSVPPSYGLPQSAPQQGWMPQSSLPPQTGMQQSDARHQEWIQQQRRDALQQQARINIIRDEHTVADSEGFSYQVDREHARYYVNRRDNTYIGTDSTTEREDLYRLYGVNPDDYEEVRIQG